jgi:hypothetical protein
MAVAMIVALLVLFGFYVAHVTPPAGLDRISPG